MKRIYLLVLLWGLLVSPSLAQTASFDFSDICVGDTLTLINRSSSNDSIVSLGWDLNGNGLFTDASGDTIKRVFTQAGAYAIGLRIATSTGLSNAIYHQVNVGVYPTADFSVISGCVNEFSEFQNLSTAEDEDLEDFRWQFGDGTFDNFSTNPKHWYIRTGIYNVSLIAISTFGCSDTISKSVEINALPTVSLTFEGDTIFDEGQSVIVSAAGDYDRILWSTGETFNPITISTAGYYFAQVFQAGCPVSKYFTIQVNNRTGFTNLITPNGDGYNDYLKIFHLEDHAPCQVDIYSREGIKVYSSSNYSNNWSGTYNGQALPEGTYIYIAKCKDNKIQKGTVNILR